MRHVWGGYGQRSFVVVTSISLTIMLSSCLSYNPLLRQIRNTVAEGRATHKEVSDKISALLTSLEVVTPLQMLIDAPYKLPVLDIYSNDLSPHLGIYTENPTSPGDFSKFVAAPNDVVVLFNNGVTVVVSAIGYDLSGRLLRFTLDVSSDTSLPSEEQVTMLLAGERQYEVGSIAGVESFGRKMTGTASFLHNGIPSTFTIHRAMGTNLDLNVTVSYGVGFVYKISNKLTQEFYDLERVFSHAPSDVPGTWAVQSASENYSDKNVNVNIELGLPGRRATTTAYYETKLGSVAYQGEEYASLTGGPVLCDLSTRTNLVSSIPIVMKYVDDVEQAVMPSNMFSCALFAIDDPTLP